MKIFIDSANLAEIESALKRGFIQGITTNPSLLSKEPKSSFEGHVGKIIELIQKYKPGIHLSVEVFSKDPQEMIAQAQRFVDQFQYKQMSIKVQIGWNELEVISELTKRGISVNCTAIMTVSQALMAASAGAKYVSLFWGRIRDGGTEEATKDKREDLLARKVVDMQEYDPAFAVRSTRELLEKGKYDCEIIAGSIRSVTDVRDAALAGAHIITTPPKFFVDMTSHYKTDQVVEQFLTDFSSWFQQA
jgi:transaldolase